MRVAAVASLVVLAASAVVVGGLALRSASAVVSGETGGGFAKETVWKTFPLGEGDEGKGKYPTSIDLYFEGNSAYAYVQYDAEGFLNSFDLSGFCGNGRIWFANEDGVSFAGTLTGTPPRRTLKVTGRILGESGITEVKFAARETPPDEEK
jgi:hypothetical protein